ncbi:sensor histidine kinase [Nocardia jejuensis]|uniref:sensor histidine kinase n=1 Tax=Nocardia jejuensis TaxID=328049 RepID=UPI000B25B5AD|nr:sensor histidine kinase [Nocardia jejuensis]
MEAAPRSWQFSLSNWPVTRKVGIVLVLPVLLAATFAVLRINSELQVLSKLGAGSDQSEVLMPIVNFITTTDDLAVTAISDWGSQDTSPAMATATTKFDQAVAKLESQLRVTNLDPAITKQVSQAVTSAQTMRNGLRSSSPQALGDQAAEVSSLVQTALASSPSIGDMRVQQSFLQFGSALAARSTLTQERVMLAIPDGSKNPVLSTKLLTTIGAELTMIEVYRGLIPGDAANADVLKDAASTRIGILMQGIPDPGLLPVMQDSLRKSVDAYTEEVTRVSASMDAKLGVLTTEARNNVLRDTSLVIGVLLAGLAIALVVARSLVVPVRRLRRDALQVAHIDLPQELELVRAGGVTPDITPVDVHTTEEIGQLARAVDDIHAQALHLAADQARLRLQIGSMFETLSRRSQSLVEQQLTLIEELERDEDDSERLQSLFRLDHLATRMRRNGDNLLVLAGTALRRGHLAPVPLSDMLWSSVSQVEDYQRVEIGTVPDGIVAGEPAVDIEHLLAELIDNALRYSPPSTPVAVSVARAVDGGYLIEITDRGLGMNAEDLQSINDRLASGGEVNVETARRMGLFVVGRLAKRHNITVSLRRTSAMVQQPGITASVHLPGTLVSPAPDRGGDNTGQFPVTAALPISPSVATAGAGAASGPQPAITPPRLMPVPNLPNQPEPVSAGGPNTGRFGVTSSGLPQRKSPGDTGEQPVYSEIRSEKFDRFSDGFTDAFSDSTDTSVYNIVTPQPETAAAQPEPQVDFWGNGGQADQRPDTVPPAGGNRGGSEDGYGSSFENGYSAFGGGTPVSAGAGSSTGNGGTPANGSYVTGSFRGDNVDTGNGGFAPAGNGGAAPAGNGNGANSTRGDAAAPAAQQRPGAPQPGLRPVGEAPTPIYQRMVSEWLVEPAAGGQSGAAWSSSSDAGWAAAEEAANPATTDRTQGGLPIRRPGAQLVPGAVTQEDESAPLNPDEIRNSLTRHLSGVRSGRADSQYNDGGHA